MLSYPKFIFIFYFSATIVLAADPPYGRLSVNNGKLVGSDGNPAQASY